MRIIAGTHKGHVLRAPAGMTTRPTSGKVREALFAILPDPRGVIVWDVCAGAGGLGLEAISRGAAQAVFVDRAEAAIRTIKANVQALNVQSQATIVRTDALRFVADTTCPTGPLWILADPPYASDLGAQLLAQAGARAWPATMRFVLEHDGRHLPPSTQGSLRQVDQRRYGDNWVTFFHPEAT